MNKVVVLLLAVCIHSNGFGQRTTDTAGLIAKTDSGVLIKNEGWLSVKSTPPGAEIYEGSLFLGVTPIDSLSMREGTHVLRSFFPSARFWNSLSAIDTVTVIPSREKTCMIQFSVAFDHRMLESATESAVKNPNLFLDSPNNENTRLWLGYAAGATMILSGTVSAYLKTNSDTYFDTYVANRDPNLLSKVHRLDSWAGVTLFISEISFGVLTYLLLSK